jgi:hypothetical protein
VVPAGLAAPWPVGRGTFGDQRFVERDRPDLDPGAAWGHPGKVDALPATICMACAGLPLRPLWIRA